MKIRVVETREVCIEVKDTKSYADAEQIAVKAVANGEVQTERTGFAAYIM